MHTKAIPRALLTLLFFGLVSNAAAAEKSSAVALEQTETRRLYSNRLDREFRLMIAKPLGPPGLPSERYPVIYLLDTDIAFPMVRQIVMSLQGGNEMPAALIVGIGYPGGFREAMKYRTLDYTPTTDAGYAKFAEKWEAAGGKAQAGGAQAFLSFFRHELKPFIEKSYKVDKEDATIIGASFGGLFAAYALFHEPETFQRYILSSPSLWWDRHWLLAAEKRFAEKRLSLPARVFIGVGGRENERDEEAALARAPERLRQSMLDFVSMVGDHAQMLELVQPFAARLKSRKYKDFYIQSYVFPDDTHASTPPLAICRGLRVVFGTF